jgi:uncharacterized BrkB/YihY/UPF0761 family membrane protein
VAADDPTVAIIGQAVSAVVATVLWAYLASVAILVGGELNVELQRRPGARGGRGAEGRGVSAVLNDVPRVLTSHGR